MGATENQGIFDNYLKTALWLGNFFTEDIIIGITDREKFIEFIGNENIPINIHSGDDVPEDDAIYKAMKQGKRVVVEVPKEAFGFAFRAIAIPIKDDNGNIIGGFGIGKNLAKQQQISNLSSNLAASLEQIAITVNQISKGVHEVATTNSEMVAMASETTEETKKTDEIIKFVNGISNQTNLLGLNAAIEAARAGESGRGFAVVADEIRKMSLSSGESIKEIDEVLKKVKSSVDEIMSSVEATSAVFQEQAASLEEMSASIQQLSSSAEILDEIAKTF